MNQSRTLTTLFLSLSALFVGCHVDQKAEVATYRRVLQAEPATRPAPTLPPTEPLTLTAALHLANEHNEQLSVQGENYLQALIQKRRAVEAFFSPTAGGSAGISYSNSHSPSNTFTFDGRTNHSLNLSLSEDINLFNGFRDINSIRRDAYLIRQSRYELLDFQNSILLDVATSFYNVLVDERTIAVDRDTVQVDNEQIAYQQAKLNSGLVRPLDLAQTQATAATHRVTLTTDLARLRNERALLALLMGVEHVESPLVDDLILPPTIASVHDILLQAGSNRQDLLAAREAIEAARYNVKIAVGEYYPSVNLNLSQALYNDPASISSWGASLPFTVPIFTAGAIHQDVREAWSIYRQTVQSASYLARQVIEQTRVAVENFQSSYPTLQDLQYGVDAAAKANDLAQRSYTVGTATNLDRLVAENALLDARKQLLTTQLSQKLSFIQLRRSVGNLTPPTPADLSTTRPATMSATIPSTQP